MSDGRYIDSSIATLEGEASHQEAPRPLLRSETWHLIPSPGGEDPTYYDRPVIKPPVWIWSIPLYFYVGGLAGASMVMGMAAQLFGGKQLRRFDERCRWVGAIGGGIGSALLIHDLGRKERFLLMLRVFRPTSPMSVGSWVLAAATPLSAGSALLTFAEGWLRRAGHAAGIGAGVLGLPLSSYTAVLIANTAVPVWSQTRRELPVLFAASSMASMAALFEFMRLDARERAIMSIFGTVGRAAELAAAEATERAANRVRTGRQATGRERTVEGRALPNVGELGHFAAARPLAGQTDRDWGNRNTRRSGAAVCNISCREGIGARSASHVSPAAGGGVTRRSAAENQG